MRNKIFQSIKLLAIWVIITVCLLSFLEGGASILMALKDAQRQISISAERLHTKFDDQIGWVNLPNIHIPDMYGKGAGLKINGQGFRDDEETSRESPAGIKRILLSGDSFTFGYGVSNQHAWANLIETPKLKTINMGLGGYGLDQMYLLQQRNAPKYQHDLHIVVVINASFIRMRRETFSGYPKPFYLLENDKASLQNVPLPDPPEPNPLLSYMELVLRELRLVFLFERLALRFGLNQPDDGGRPAANSAYYRKLAMALLTDVYQKGKKNNIKTIVIWLPERNDLLKNVWEDFRKKLFAELEAKGIPTLDLVVKLQQLNTAKMLREMFIQSDISNFRGAKGHYTPLGNQWTADEISRYLESKFPEIAGR